MDEIDGETIRSCGVLNFVNKLVNLNEIDKEYMVENLLSN